MPPTPLERDTPIREASSFSRSRPLSLHSLRRRVHGKLGKTVHPAGFLFIQHLCGIKIFDLRRQCHFWFVVSYKVMGAIPHTPARAASQVSGTVWPRGVTAPIPVMTTRLFSIMFNPFCGLNRHTAVYTQYLTGDVGGLIRGKEGHCPGHILRLPQPGHGNRLEHSFFCLLRQSGPSFLYQ